MDFSLFRRPVVDRELLHGEIGDIGGRQARPDPDRGRCDETVRLVKGDTLPGERSTPVACADTLGRSQRCQAEPIHESAGNGILVGSKPPPDLFDGDRTDPWLCAGPAEPDEPLGRRSTAKRIDEHRRVEQQASHVRSPNPTGVFGTLPAHPRRRIAVPIVAVIRELPESPFDVVPASFVFETAPDQFGDERTASPWAGTVVEFGHEVIVECYV